MMYALITMPLGIPLKLAPSISLPGGHATTLTSQGPERSSATCTEPGKLKLVINTCTQNAAGPMAMIQRTLEQVGFACWSDVIVVEGNADDEAAPAPMAAVNTTGVHTMTLIRTSKNNYDFHAYSALYKYREDPTVKAPSYLYMHDTCIPNPYFVDRFNAIATELDGKPKEILAVTKLQSNIYAFGSDVVEAYQHNFDPQIEKFPGTVQMERCNHPTVRCLNEFGDLKDWGARRKVGEAGSWDPFGTGIARTRYDYETFGFAKYIHYYADHSEAGNANLPLNLGYQSTTGGN